MTILIPHGVDPDSYTRGFDAGWMACDDAEQASDRAHRRRLDELCNALAAQCRQWDDDEQHAEPDVLRFTGILLRRAAVALLEHCSPRAPLPRERTAEPDYMDAF